MSGFTGGVSAVNGQVGAISSYSTPQGRLTLQTAAPVMTTTQSAKTTIFYTPYVGNMVPLYDGTNMVPTVVAEISVVTTDTTKNPAAIGASKVNDWFVWNDAGTIRLSHGPDWTSDTVRSAGTALTMVNGIYLNSVSITNGPAASRGTYVGTTRSNASSQLDWILGAAASGGTAAFLGLWNMYNRVSTSTVVTDSGVSYTYTTATIRQARASAANQISFVLGLQEDGIQWSHLDTLLTTTAASAFGSSGVGFDSTTAFGANPGFAQNPASGVNLIAPLSTAGVWSAGIGLHVLAALEKGDGTNANTFDFSSLSSVSAVVRN